MKMQIFLFLFLLLPLLLLVFLKTLEEVHVHVGSLLLPDLSDLRLPRLASSADERPLHLLVKALAVDAH